MHRPLTAMLALAALTIPQVASAATCLEEKEVSGIVAFATPGVLETVSNTCKPHVGSKGFIATRADAMVANYGANRDAAWPLAKAAFLKFSGSGNEKADKAQELMAKLPDDVLKPLVEAAISTAVSDDVKPEQCGQIERLMEVMNRIQPQDSADLIATLMSLVGGGKSARSFQICPAPAVKKD